MNDKATILLGRKRRVVGFVLALLVIAGGLSWYISRNREPMYEGKPLNYWLECFDLKNKEISFYKAAHAIRTIGTNGIPTLLVMFQKTDSTFKVRLITFLEKQRFLKIKWSPASDQVDEAVVGFEILGPKAQEAVPTLVQIYSKNISRNSRSHVLEILSSIGPSADQAVPALTCCLTNTDDELRPQIVLTLAQIHACPEIAIPALTNYLREAGSDRLAVAMALASYGADASPALPALRTLLNDKEVPVRDIASVAISRIDPQTVGKFDFQTNRADSPR